jgi:hypothetical protein
MEKSKRNRRTDNVVTLPALESGSRAQQSADIDDSDIARRSYTLYEERGNEHGRDLDDWLQAERELRDALSSTAT